MLHEQYTHLVSFFYFSLFFGFYSFYMLRFVYLSLVAGKIYSLFIPCMRALRTSSTNADIVILPQQVYYSIRSFLMNYLSCSSMTHKFYLLIFMKVIFSMCVRYFCVMRLSFMPHIENTYVYISFLSISYRETPTPPTTMKKGINLIIVIGCSLLQFRLPYWVFPHKSKQVTE